MRYAFIAEKRVAFPVAALCRVMRVSRSGFYGSSPSPRPSGSAATRASLRRRAPCLPSTRGGTVALACAANFGNVATSSARRGSRGSCGRTVS